MSKELPTAEKNVSVDTHPFNAGYASDTGFGAVSYTQANKSVASHYTDLSNIGGDNISGRPGLTFADYYKFRPNERPPSSPKGIIHASDLAYKEIDIVRNTIDLMADFVTQGIRISHQDPVKEQLGQNWFSDIVNGDDVSERFANYALRLGNGVVRRYMGKPTLKQIKRLTKGIASISQDKEVDIESIKTLNHLIPAKYSFIDPMIVHIVGGPIAGYSSVQKYGIKLPMMLAHAINNPTKEQEEVIRALPSDIKEAAKHPEQFYVLPSDKIEVFHYKKDDWETWANPIIGSIIKPLITLEKMNLADMTALDGAISKVRIFAIGSLDPVIPPDPDLADKLNQALQSNVGGGTMDVVWGPDIKVIETNTEASTFLGSEKYEVTLMRIYAGLGIPPTLTGSFGASGTTNNFISLRTMITRLGYCRKMLVKFWKKELKILQKAMGYPTPFQIEFDIVDFGDEAAQRALLIQMVDRNLISEERLQQLFNLTPNLEESRIKRENKERVSGKRPYKPNPLRDADADMRKTALQLGIAAPSEVGLELEPKKAGEKNAMELKMETAPKPTTTKPKGVSGKGRPKNSKDSGPRKQKAFNPKVKAAIELWASAAQSKIDELITPLVLEHCDKKNSRCLTAAESDMAESLKYGVLSNLEPLSDLTDDAPIFSALRQTISQDAINTYNSLVASTKEITKKEKFTMSELRQLQLISYIEYSGDKYGQD